MLTGADSNLYVGGWWYPKSFVAPNGQVFMLNNGKRDMSYLEVTGDGSLSKAGEITGQSFNQRMPAVMYGEGKILTFRGVQDAITIDINSVNPVVTNIADLATARHWALADGQVLVTGGSEVNQTLPGINYTELILNQVHGHAAQLPRKRGFITL